MSPPKSVRPRLPSVSFRVCERVEMRYFQFHIGDYASHTRHLNYTEDLAYRRLLDFYYLHEQPIKQREIARQIGMRDCEQEVLSVLEEFFVSTDEGYINPRADREIEAYKAMKDAGKRGAEKRWSQDKSSTSDAPPIATPSPPHSHPNDTPIATINHEPVTNNHKPKVMRGTRLDHDCLLPPDWSNFCKEKRPDLVPREVFDSFKDYWIAQPGQKGVKLDWDATWRNWVRSQKVKPGAQLTVPSRPERDPALVKLDQDRKNREQIPAEVRQQLQSILRR